MRFCGVILAIPNHQRLTYQALQRNVQRMQRAIPRQRGEEVPSRWGSATNGAKLAILAVAALVIKEGSILSGKNMKK